MVSDFFFPQPGGIESHIYQLSTKLIDRGHKVIIITHAYKGRTGVRYLTNGLKVYHVPFFVIYRESTMPTVFSFFPIFRNIVIHAASILTNKLLKFILSDVDHVICVSHTWYVNYMDYTESILTLRASKENTVLRASLDPLMVSVIPNAVVAENFRPPEPRPIARLMEPNDIITIVVISRPKAIDLEQMLERNVLQDKVELLGSVRHEEVRDVMIRGHIYLHPSLTEAFGTVLVEAASCGLYVVCTRVGGIPEVLPQHMTTFAKPEEDDIVLATGKAIAALRSNKVRTDRFHDQVKMMYSWTDVAERTERVYQGISGDISPEEFYGYYPGQGWEAGRDRVRSFALIDRLKRYYGCGVWAGKLFCLCVVIDFLLYVFLEMWFPRANIDIARSWPKKINRKENKRPGSTYKGDRLGPAS
ncbi:hypothetical protein ASPNIDRAFT_35759 [Aspergillus niger ATCC 1015]|uniref:PIGA GPI anchor biosynthesis domain-containing protein n=1 Tax=Aspergillus niger (strain ATCC 1015 / CBS 113.46 / FGSC A1144 / LSHB Ac4 / NCTC 3858a / NRRL 328 / USDA 3528.7) TaxID=380704 RepID=G3XTU7_ASPNA|nr:hypothetical protein ASPNIDRAFT_35759 [Aspergillus niger ATCC 1015]